jgi:hypothetical protein
MLEITVERFWHHIDTRHESGAVFRHTREYKYLNKECKTSTDIYTYGSTEHMYSIREGSYSTGTYLITKLIIQRSSLFYLIIGQWLLLDLYDDRDGWKMTNRQR